jgi:LacI family transcriptional regulator
MPIRPRVALLVESSRAYGRGLLHGIAEYIRLHGPWSVYMAERGLGDAPPSWLNGWEGDGVIARIENRRIAQAIAELGLPTVDLRGLLSDLGLPLIATDDVAVSGLAVEHFLERGFRSFAFCGFASADYSDNRSRAFADLVEEAGFTCHVYQPSRKGRGAAVGTMALEQGGLTTEAEVAQWIEALPKPVGLMACNDIRGQQVLNACRDVEIAVPEDVAVLGVDNDDVLCDLSYPTLSSVLPDTRRIGFEAAALLEAMIGGEPPPQAPLLIPPLGVVTRRSTDVLAIEDRHLARAVQFIREHACEGITVEDVLANIPLSRSVFERRFARLFGHSPKAEIVRARLDRIKRLLAETELPLKQIAARIGFEHPEYMNVVFKEQTGQTPGQYRAAFRQNKVRQVAAP